MESISKELNQMVEDVMMADDDQSSKSNFFPNELSCTFNDRSDVISSFS